MEVLFVVLSIEIAIYVCFDLEIVPKNKPKNIKEKQMIRELHAQAEIDRKYYETKYQMLEIAKNEEINSVIADFKRVGYGHYTYANKIYNTPKVSTKNQSLLS
ncbi:hypothetical protein LO769_13045 (plasmid) [Lactococcus lactis subsp. lactis]|uniref:hypothetical protein n=1 Tax=Lactococcus lactis TaxID=1358 RepID=UPI00207911C3|nr:hypothetical protein [Lactococcus lactis]USI64371.1 hypothetical protein LO769_13045 [Lactococcus lactis subsp. lactis]